jgi:tubulin epsilon
MFNSRFWDLALREHSSLNKKAQFDEALSTFFRNVDIKKSQDTVEIPVLF